MSRPVTAIRNVGPKSAAAFAKAGLHTAEEVEALGADAAYARLLATGVRPHFIGYYVLVLGLQGRPWTDLGAPEKAALRVRFDALVAERAPQDEGRSRLEAALRKIGVVELQPTSSRPEKK